MKVLNRLVGAIEEADYLDGTAKALAEMVTKATSAKAVKNALSGTWLGHPLHPLLTDIPIGCWVAASFLDIVGGEKGARSAQRLVGLGILAAVPTALSGEADWSDTHGPEQRVGMVHGLMNTAAVATQALSYRARRQGRRGSGVLLSTSALGMVTAAGYLGGHLSFVRGVGVNHTAFEELPSAWTEVGSLEDLEEGRPTRATAGDVPVVLVRRASSVDVLSATCVHAGGPLDEGDIVGECIRCPWHGSEFRLSDGKAERGPAAIDQPAWDARVSDGRIEVRPRR